MPNITLCDNNTWQLTLLGYRSRRGREGFLSGSQRLLPAFATKCYGQRKHWHDQEASPGTHRHENESQAAERPPDCKLLSCVCVPLEAEQIGSLPFPVEEAHSSTADHED